MTSAAVRACTCVACAYCDQPLAGVHEHDHAPIPAECGGTALLACCVNCHSLKDRARMGDAHLNALDRRWRKLDPMERLVLMRMTAAYHRATAVLEGRLPGGPVEGAA